MRELIDGLVPPREAVVTITAHVEADSPRTSITTLVTEELLERL